MRGRESGMPSVELWETFFDASEIVEKLSDPSNRRICVEFGCGYGTFTLAAASLAGVDQVTAFDLDDAMQYVLPDQFMRSHAIKKEHNFPGLV